MIQGPGSNNTSFLITMATCVGNEVVAAVENEICCPICLEEFEEPKCLPSCAHNVCQLCLEGMIKKRNNVIECPVCRAKSIIPDGGVAAFPKNHLLVRLIERSPGRKEKKCIKEALNNCNEKLGRAKTALEGMEDRFEKARSEVEETRKKIASTAERIITMVRVQEQKLMDEVDKKFRESVDELIFVEQKSTTLELCENASFCMQTVQDIMENAELADVKDMKDALVEELDDFSKSLEIQTSWAISEFCGPFDVSFTTTNSVEKFIEDECALGKLVTNATSSQPQPFVVDVADSDLSQPQGSVGCAASVKSFTDHIPDQSVADYSSFGSVLLTVDNSSTRISNFNPFAVACWRNSGHFAALDEEKKRVYIFNERGEESHSFRIPFGDLWDIAVANDEIVVVNRESNRLLHYEVDGTFKKKHVAVPRDDIKFTSLSVDLHGRFIISSSQHYGEEVLPCVLVYNPSGRFISFGEGILQSPEKATFLNGKFFVPDSECGSVFVFDKSGDFVNEIGQCQLKSPSSAAADYVGKKVLVSDNSNSTIYVFSQEGILLQHFHSQFPPKQIALTDNCKKLLICSDTGDSRNKIQLVTYRL